MQKQLIHPETNELLIEEDLKTPDVKQSNGYLQLHSSDFTKSNHYRSNSTGLKPKTAVRLQSLPWNF